MNEKTGVKTRVFCVSFGGNVDTEYGPPLETMKKALAQLEIEGVRITAVSRFFDTPAFPAGSGPNFVNGALKVETTLDSQGLIVILNKIEAAFGRVRTSRWGARTLDLDILFAGDDILPDRKIWQVWHDLPAEKQQNETPDQLIVPHPRMQDRAFVLVPLADVAPDWIHPVLGKTVRQMVDDLPDALKNEVKLL